MEKHVAMVKSYGGGLLFFFFVDRKTSQKNIRKM